MNYIARLQGDLAEAQEQLQTKGEALRAFRAHIAGEKFSGFDSNGSRRIGSPCATSMPVCWRSTPPEQKGCGGVDNIAMLIGLRDRRVPIELIIFLPTLALKSRRR